MRFVAPILAVLALLAPPALRAEPTLLNGLAALANDAVITFDEVQSYSRRALEAAARAVERRRGNQEDFEKEARRITKDGLEQLIDRRLIIDEFKTSGFNLPDSIVDDIIKDRIKREFGDRLTLTKTLRKLNQTYESFRLDEKESFIIAQMVMKNVPRDPVISPKRIEKAWQADQDKYRVGNRVKLRMILFDPSRHAQGEPRKLGEQALAKIRAGTDFAKVADEMSDDSRRFKGGDRGWVEDKDSDLRKELRDVAFKLEPGTVSDLIEISGAVFILKSEDRRNAEVKPLSEVREEIENNLKTQEKDRLQKAWIARLRRKAFVRYF